MGKLGKHLAYVFSVTVAQEPVYVMVGKELPPQKGHPQARLCTQCVFKKPIHALLHCLEEQSYIFFTHHLHQIGIVF